METELGEKWLIPPGLMMPLSEFTKEVYLVRKRHILIEGPPRVGKSLFVHLFEKIKEAEHKEEKPNERWKKPRQLNCAEFRDSNLLISELFGHKKGSFTGAVSDKKGLLESDGAEIIILDEIGELTKSDQAKLLTFLTTGAFKPLGSTEIKNSKVQIIATTNQTQKAHDRQRDVFRDDFFYRFELVFPVPPLHERRWDILYYLHLWNPRILTLLRKWEVFHLLNYSWPGNVAEIKRVCRNFEKNCLSRIPENVTEGLNEGPGNRNGLYKELTEMPHGARQALEDYLKDSRLAISGAGSEELAFPEFRYDGGNKSLSYVSGSGCVLPFCKNYPDIDSQFDVATMYSSPPLEDACHHLLGQCHTRSSCKYVSGATGEELICNKDMFEIKTQTEKTLIQSVVDSWQENQDRIPAKHEGEGTSPLEEMPDREAVIRGFLRDADFKEVERILYAEKYSKFDGNITALRKHLGLSENTVRGRLEKYSLHQKRKKHAIKN